MPARLTPAQAQALGITASAPPRVRRTRKAMGRDGAVSRCVTCHATFTTDTAETRHVEQAHHYRFETLAG